MLILEHYKWIQMGSRKWEKYIVIFKRHIFRKLNFMHFVEEIILELIS